VINFSVTCDMLVVFSTNKTDLRDKTDILLKVALNTINLSLNLKLLFTICNHFFYFNLMLLPVSPVLLNVEVGRVVSGGTVSHLLRFVELNDISVAPYSFRIWHIKSPMLVRLICITFNDVRYPEIITFMP